MQHVRRQATDRCDDDRSHSCVMSSLQHFFRGLTWLTEWSVQKIFFTQSFFERLPFLLMTKRIIELFFISLHNVVSFLGWWMADCNLTLHSSHNRLYWVWLLTIVTTRLYKYYLLRSKCVAFTPFLHKRINLIKLHIMFLIYSLTLVFWIFVEMLLQLAPFILSFYWLGLTELFLFKKSCDWPGEPDISSPYWWPSFEGGNPYAPSSWPQAKSRCIDHVVARAHLGPYPLYLWDWS